MSEKIVSLNLTDDEWRKLSRYAKRAGTSLYPFLATITREWLTAREWLDSESKPT